MTLAVLSFVFSSVIPAHAQAGTVWKKTGAPSGVRWASIASSADGDKLLAATTSGTICMSTNAGDTWTTNSLPVLAINYGKTAASSADGTVLAVCSYFGNIYVSTNSGATWTPRGSSQNYNAVACSSNGTKMVACVGGGYLYTSADTGTTWTQRDSSRQWSCVASSADGTKLMASEGGNTNGYIYASTDSGVTWGQRVSAFDNYVSVASSADGSVLIAATHHDNFTQPDYTPGNVGYIYSSTDGGANWTFPGSTRSPAMQYNCVTISADATLAAGCGDKTLLSDPPGVIVTSTDSLWTWQLGYAPDTSWTCIASSADGKKLAACSRYLDSTGTPGAIYTYAEPSTNVPSLNIAMGSGNLHLSWPWPSSGIVLQQNTNLATTNWVNVTNLPAVVNQVITPATGGSNFYRLSKP